MSMKLSEIAIAMSIAAVPTGLLAKDTHATDLQKTCGQPFAGQVIRVSCENTSSILALNPGFTTDTPVKNMAQGTLQTYQDSNGNPILLVATPAKKRK